MNFTEIINKNLNMSDFELFKSITENYNTTHTTAIVDICKHCDAVEENGIVLCADCGEEINRPLLHDKEWRYYGSGDSKRSSDPNRVHARKIDEKNIAKDVESMSFSETIVAKANELYTQCTNGQIYRGGSRKSVIFACIFHAYKLAGKHQTPDVLIQVFGLSRKAGLKGLKIVNINIPKDSEIHDTCITSKHIICDIMDKFKTSNEHKQQVYDIYDKVKNRSSKLNRARPQSVAAAVIFYWVKLNNINIQLVDFAKTTNLSELTIVKNMKEVETIFMNNPL
jgi:transcription initiation factor TFIIIB Brf1 subunit/transcription initiation factor TFIIB